MKLHMDDMKCATVAYQRNGSYRRTLKTRVGALVLDVPRDRAGVFRASLFAIYERSEQVLVLAMVEMYFHGVATRKVNAVVEQLCGRKIDRLRRDAPRVADWLADTQGETLACYALSRDYVRRKLRSTNALEAHHHIVRRRTRVIRIFPHEASLLRLLTALAIEQNDRWRHKRWIVKPTFIEQEEPPQRSA
jgi:transposase-like protein